MHDYDLKEITSRLDDIAEQLKKLVGIFSNVIVVQSPPPYTPEEIKLYPWIDKPSTTT